MQTRSRICAMTATLALASAAMADGFDLNTPAPKRADAPAAMETPQANDGWRVDFNSWIWMPSISGDAGVRGQSADVSASFGDILQASDSIFAFSGRLEVGKGDWGGFIDGMYFNLGVEDQSGPGGAVNLDVTFQMTMIDFGVMYRLGQWEATGDAGKNRRDTTLDLYAGGRFTNLDIEIAPASAPAVSRDHSWVDPIVGFKVVHPFSESWHIRANADIGGFGAASDLTWSATGVLGYDFQLFEHPATVFGGYRAIGQDYSDGSGTNTFKWDVVQHGPILGFAFKF